ncbi:hypothetical protein RIF29_05801 [Crotalaria pallida]|uniref:Uncharacterized protein n=1 Tax=Crotalaria pallida TaxID=3830 RepID=A0AAN9J3H6_CROPI
MKQAEEAKLKCEAAKAAFDTTFKELEKCREKGVVHSDSEFEEFEDLARRILRSALRQVMPRLSVRGSEQEGIVKDMGEGTYTITYVVPKRGNYMVSVECNGNPIVKLD